MKAVGCKGQGAPETSLICELLCERIGFPEMLERTFHLAQRRQSVSKLESKVDCVFLSLAALGEMRQGRQGLFKVRHRLAIGRPCQRLGARSLQIGQGLVPNLTPERVMSQSIDMLLQLIGVKRFHRSQDAR